MDTSPSLPKQNVENLSTEQQPQLATAKSTNDSRFVFNFLIVIILLLLTTGVGLFAYNLGQQQAINSNQIPTGVDQLSNDILGCQEDAMICPDGTTVGRVPPKCEFEACQAAGVIINDSAVEYLLPRTPSNSNLQFILQLPAESAVEENKITIGQNTYTLRQALGHGLCPQGDPNIESKCGYDDQQVENMYVFRIWKNQQGYFAINPQAVTHNSKTVGDYIVEKVSPTVVISQAEIELWKELFSSQISLAP